MVRRGLRWWLRIALEAQQLEHEQPEPIRWLRPLRLLGFRLVPAGHVVREPGVAPAEAGVLRHRRPYPSSTGSTVSRSPSPTSLARSSFSPASGSSSTVTG